MNLDTINGRLKEFRRIVFPSNSAMARALGMSPSNLQKYLSGEMNPGNTVLDKLYRLGLNINWLLTGEGSMFADTYRGFQLTKQYGMENEASLEYWKTEAQKREEDIARLEAALADFQTRNPLSLFDRNRIKNLQKLAQLGKVTIADINELIAILAKSVDAAAGKRSGR